MNTNNLQSLISHNIFYVYHIELSTIKLSVLRIVKIGKLGHIGVSNIERQAPKKQGVSYKGMTDFRLNSSKFSSMNEEN